MAGSSGSREISKNYPCVDGIVARTTTQKGHKETLEAQEVRMEKGWGSI